MRVAFEGFWLPVRVFKKFTSHLIYLLHECANPGSIAGQSSAAAMTNLSKATSDRCLGDPALPPRRPTPAQPKIDQATALNRLLDSSSSMNAWNLNRAQRPDFESMTRGENG